MRSRKHVNLGFEPTLDVFYSRVENLSAMAWTAYDYADVMDACDLLESAEADLRRIYQQCVGLCEIWPTREKEFVQTAYGLLEQQIKTILRYHDEAMRPAEEIEVEWL